MKISCLLAFSLVIVLLSCVSLERVKVAKDGLKKAVKNENVVKSPPVNITNPQDTILYQFALGAADILVSDKGAAKECQLQPWMVDQPTIQKGTAKWFADWVKELEALKGLLDVYALQSVCSSKRHKERLQGWIGGALEKEDKRYKYALSKNITYDANDLPHPYGNLSVTVPKPKRKRKFIASQAEMKVNSKVKSKSKTKDWWGVLEISLPLVPYHLKKFQLVLKKVMGGFIYVQFEEYVNCIARSPDTPKNINSVIIGFMSLSTFMRTGGNDALQNIFTLLFCNWNRFVDHVNTMISGVKEHDDEKKWLKFGQGMAKFLIAIGTGTDSFTKKK